jgi:hypothetical protein
MTNYIINQDIINGFNPKTNLPNILFKKGDKVSGIPIQRFIWNKNTMGIETKPTVANSYSETPTEFIPLTSLQEEKTTSTTTNQPNQTKNILKFALLGLVIYFLVKK